MIECTHKFLEIDYDNITMTEIIKFKLSALDVLSSIERWNEPKGHDNYPELDNFSIITTGAFGVINNPYQDVISHISKMKYHLMSVVQSISEYWILENLNMMSKKQTFNSDLLLTYNRNYTKEESLKNWMSIVDNFDNAIKLYNEAQRIRDTKILKKYLGFVNTKNKVDGFWYEYKDGYCVKMKYEDGKLRQKKYHFGGDWHIYSSNETVKFSKEDTEYEYIWKVECPELYLV